MRNHTIVNLFVMPDNLEYVTSQLKDLPVVAKKLGSSYRVQFTCDYVGMRQTHMEIFYYDKEEMDHYMIKIATDIIFRMTIFAKDVTPDDYSDEWSEFTEYLAKKRYVENPYGDIGCVKYYDTDSVKTDDEQMIKKAFTEGNTHAVHSNSTGDCVSVDTKSIYPRVIN